MKSSRKNEKHGCLYTGFGLLVLTVMVMIVLPSLSSWAALFFACWLCWTVLHGLWAGRDQADDAFFSNPELPVPFIHPIEQPGEWAKINQQSSKQVYEVSDGLHRALVTARSANEAQYKFVRSFGGMVELTVAKRQRQQPT